MGTEHLVLDPQVRAEIEALAIEHAWLVDNDRADLLADLYTEDGRMIGIGPDKIGQDAIRAYGKTRAGMTQRIARHVVSNMRILPDGPDRVRSTHIVTLFRADGAAVPPADPIAVADIHEIHVRNAQGRWRIQERRLAIIFESEAHRAG